MLNLSTDILEKILFKFHRFNYLFNINLVSKELNIVTNKILNYHFNKLNFILNDNNILNKKIYILISKYLYNYKILNLKYYNFIKDINTHNFIKIIILFNTNSSTKKNNLYIIPHEHYINFFKNNNSNSDLKEDYISFMVIYIQTGYSLHIQYNHNLNKFKFNINNPVNRLSLNKIIEFHDLLDIIKFTENSLFTYVYKNYLLKYFN